MTREHCQREREAFNAFCDRKEIESRRIWRNALDGDPNDPRFQWNIDINPVFTGNQEHRIAQKPVDVEELRKLVVNWRNAGVDMIGPSQIIYLYHSDALERVLNGGKA